MRRVQWRFDRSAPACDAWVTVFVPPMAPPAGGFPVIVMLDGDAVASVLHMHLQHHTEPVIVVAVGYGLQGDSLKAARAFDYTPGPTLPDPRAPQWDNGGAAAFLRWMDVELRTALTAAFPVEHSAWTLYGHSYGGLFGLFALCQPEAVFNRYVLASPSIWWRDGAIRNDLEARLALSSLSADVLIMAGERESWHANAVGSDGSPDSRTGGWATLPAAQALADRLRQLNEGITRFDTIAGGTHASMARQSIFPALRFAAESSGASDGSLSSRQARSLS